jgi:geranylgeranylglycerol-phosphate geranylgeranyltransferase
VASVFERDNHVHGLIAITRPGNAIAAGIMTFIGGFVVRGVGVFDDGSRIAIGTAIVVTVLAASAGNTINDYFDREIDRINNPNRPIPSGTVTPHEALRFSAVLFAAAFVLALTLPLLAAAIAIVNLVLLVTYTRVFKGRPGTGNLVIAYLSGSTFLIGGATVGQITGTILTFFALAALSTVAREIIKDIEDMEGDREKGLQTLPIAIGKQRAKITAAIVLVIMLVASPIPYVIGEFGWAYLIIITGADGVIGYAAYSSLDDPHAGQQTLKIGMYLTAGAFILGRITALL